MAGKSKSQAGVVHWIDHWVVNTNDVERWTAFHTKVLGAALMPDPSGVLTGLGVFINFGRTRVGGFNNDGPIPATKGLEDGLPRYGVYVDQADLDIHLRRLDEAGAIHGRPFRTSAEGDSGTAIRWQDPDGNQFEFWAPDIIPDGAMEGAGPERVGRISHGVYESRDLERTAEFFRRYCALGPRKNNDLGRDTLVLPLAGGARLVFHKVETLAGRTTGFGLRDTHTALTVHTDDYVTNYQRMWADLPEWDYNPVERKPISDPGALPARTVVHPTPAGKRIKALSGRGDDFLDWDTNLFHFYGGLPLGKSMAVYEGRATEYYLPELEKTVDAIKPAAAMV
jgi:predicted enzyme related to lactoylglutathione lyase